MERLIGRAERPAPPGPIALSAWVCSVFRASLRSREQLHMAGSILSWALAHSGVESLGLGGIEQSLNVILGFLARGCWAASVRLFLPLTTHPQWVWMRLIAIPTSLSMSVNEVDCHTYLPGGTEAPPRTWDLNMIWPDHAPDDRGHLGPQSRKSLYPKS